MHAGLKELTAGAAIVCRMTSVRLPGKALALVSGKPLIHYVVESLRHVDLDLRLAVVTSTDPSDDAIALYADAHDLLVVRGSLDDVAGRFAQALGDLACDAVFRVNGDSPLIPIRMFPVAYHKMMAGNWDLVTNIFPRSYPPGMSMELVRTSTFFRAYPSLVEPDDREHVTRYFYRHHDSFQIHNICLPQDYSSVSLAIDTLADLELFRCMVSSMRRPHWTYSLEELLSLRRSVEDARETR